MKEYADIMGLGVLFLVNGAAAVMSLYDFLDKKKLVRQLEAAPFFNNGIEIGQMMEKTGKSTIPYALITGRVLATENPLTAADGSQGVYQHFTVIQHEKIRNMGGHWTNNTNVVQKHSKAIRFGLIEPFHNIGEEPQDGSAWVVHNVTRSQPESVFLQLASPTMHRYDPTDAVLSMKDGDRITAAMEKTEQFLKNYSTVTLSGKITADERGFIELNLPARGELYVAHNGTIQDVIDGHKAIRDILGTVCIITGSLALFIGGAMAYRLWKLHRRSKTEDR